MNSPIPSFAAIASHSQAPDGLNERPQDGECRECSTPVAPIRGRSRWYPRTICEACRTSLESRALALDHAEARVRRLMESHPLYLGLSLDRTSTQRGPFADEVRRVRSLPEPTLLLTKGNADAIATLRAWEPGQSILLQGPTDAGKTALMLAAVQDNARRLMPSGQACLPVQFYTAKGLLSAYLRARQERRGDTFLSQLLTKAGLWLDDLGLETAAGWERDAWNNAIADLLNLAHNGAGCLIVSTNLTLEAMGERYGAGDRVGSRLTAITGAGRRIVHVRGGGFRGVA